MTGAHPGARGLSVEGGGGKSLGRCAEGPGGDGGSWGGSLAVGWYSEQGLCAQAKPVLGTQ